MSAGKSKTRAARSSRAAAPDEQADADAARRELFVEADFARAMEAAAVGSLSAAGVCFSQAAASCRDDSRGKALLYFSRLALMFAAAAKVIDDEKGMALAAKLGAELDARVFAPGGEEVGRD